VRQNPEVPELKPWDRVPAIGYYQLLNASGTPTGERAFVQWRHFVPSAPQLYRWRLMDAAEDEGARGAMPRRQLRPLSAATLDGPGTLPSRDDNIDDDRSAASAHCSAVWGNDRGASYGESAIRSYGKSLFLQIVGLIFWFSRNRLVGSYLFLSASSRP
jgi:hypothetical protein